MTGWKASPTNDNEILQRCANLGEINNLEVSEILAENITTADEGISYFVFNLFRTVLTLTFRLGTGSMCELFQ